ncbi:hypothetical protein J2X66_004389 [Pseudomonas sp. 3296]|uniref:hypothetical protein n=1 Tax=Pseudomonas sp. 3296 TaxID=2817753 RepID=UPI00285E9CF9|nr:hypothetical protein [Pseudomonas sp. 3296]MDR6917510.1 hypothetical protein [Pseudomonas sp. 3296]
MANEKLIVTTSYGTDIPVIMAPPGHGAGISFITPNLLTFQGSEAVTDVMAEPCKRGKVQGLIHNQNTLVCLERVTRAGRGKTICKTIRKS